MSKTLAEIQDSEGAIEHDATFQNYRSVLNKINVHYGWEKDIIHYELLQEHALELPAVCQELWEINNNDALRQKLSSISSMVTRALGSGDHRIAKLMRTLNKEHSVAVKPQIRNIPEWTDLQKRLAEYGKENSPRGIIALTFSHGYVLRVAELFDTMVRGFDNGVHNYLNPDTLLWTIRIHKNARNGSVRQFSVTPEFIKALPVKAGWLIKKKNGLRYEAQSSRVLKYHDWWQDLPCNRDIRASFETWNLHSGRPNHESLESHEVLGHTKQTAETHYDKTLMKKIKVVVKVR